MLHWCQIAVQFSPIWASLIAQLVQNPPEMQETPGSIPGSGRSAGEGKGYPLQYSGLENSMDCIVHGVTKSQTQLKVNNNPQRYVLRSISSVPPIPFGSAGKESACSVGDLGSVPGLGRSPGEGKGYPLLYSGLENSMDCIDYGVTKSWT